MLRARRAEKNMKKIRVCLIIDEFFGGAGTFYGGYGFLARRLICKYIPNEDIEIDVILGKGRKKLFAEEYVEDGIRLYRLPRRKFMAKMFLKRKKYDVFLSIELTSDYVLRCSKNQRLIFWVQDPRPQYEWDEIKTVNLFPETSYYNQKIYDTAKLWYDEDKIRFITQAKYLKKLACDLYNLPQNVPMEYFPNPVDIDFDFDVNAYKKKNMIVFLGRVESVKRGWLFCEIAKKLPEYEFYMLGESFNDAEKNKSIIAQYKDIANLHFTGHVDGEVKNQYLKDAKILVNTSIHEALPISFLEAMSYGTLLVSNRNPDEYTSRFGIHVGQVLGDGFDKVDLYVDAIKKLMSDEIGFKKKSAEAVEFTRENHNVDKFIKNMRAIIYEEANRRK